MIFSLSSPQRIPPPIAAGVEVYRISGRIHGDDTRFHKEYFIPVELLEKHGEAEKSRHHYHNAARNELTRAMIEHKYPE